MKHRFTHVDPFEDTESPNTTDPQPSQTYVSPTSIRSRILKAVERPATSNRWQTSFTHVDPFENTESYDVGPGDAASGGRPSPAKARKAAPHAPLPLTHGLVSEMLVTTL